MSCLLCLRNEGIILSNESSNDFEILLNLLKLPQEFSDTLQGNQCCSLCRVKLQFVGVINNEIGILTEKLKYFEEEVKEIFVSSFNGEESQIESDRNAIDARNKLLNELNMPLPTQYEEEDNSTPEGFHIIPFKVELPNESSFDQETESSNLFISLPKHLEHEAINSSTDDNSNFEQAEDPFGQISCSSISESESTQFAPFPSFAPNQSQSDHPIPSTSSETRSIKSEHFRKRKGDMKNDPLMSHRLSTQHLAVAPNRKSRIYVCNICPTKEEFNQSEDYEIHLRIFHPGKFYSKCPKCNRIILERIKDTDFNLRQHMKTVHITGRPYKCDKCGADFKTSRILSVHKQIHLNREIFICEICESTFNGERNFKRHLRQQHSKK